MIWTEEYVINGHDMDFNDVARPSALMRCIQESAYAQHRHLGPTLEELRQNGRAFLLSRLSACFYQPVYACDVLKTNAFTTDSKGFSYNRATQLFRGETLVGEAVSVWALVDIATRRPVRVSEGGVFFEPEPPISLPIAPHIVFPKEIPLTEVGKHEVQYSEVDLNRHMNNTRYIDMFCHYLPMEGKRVASFSINYLHEAAFRTVLSVNLLPWEGKYLFRTLRPDGQVNVEAEVALADIEK